MWIRESQQGLGYGRKALKAMIQWGYSHWHWRRLEWRCDERNVASQKVAEKLGLKLEGTLKSTYKNHHGHWCDHRVYATVKYDHDDLHGNFEIRELKMSDRQALGALHADTWQDTYSGIMDQDALYSRNGATVANWWRDYFEKEDSDYILEGIFNDKGKLLGMVSYGRSEKDFEGVNFELVAINIPKAYQGFGLGKKLFKHVTKQISKMGGRSFPLVLGRKQIGIKLLREPVLQSQGAKNRRWPGAHLFGS